MVEEVINEFHAKFPKKLFFVVSSDDKDGSAKNDNVAMQSISTEIASYFAVLRDQVIRHWNLNDLEFRYSGSEE